MPNDTDDTGSVLSDYIEGDEGLARELNKSPRTIMRWRALGEAPPCTRIGRDIWYSRKAVRDWLETRTQDGGA